MPETRVKQIGATALLAVAWFIPISAAMIQAAPAHADDMLTQRQIDYVNAHAAQTICPAVAKNPTYSGLLDIMHDVTRDGFSAVEAADIVNASVLVFCGDQWSTLERVGAEARARSVVAV